MNIYGLRWAAIVLLHLEVLLLALFPEQLSQFGIFVCGAFILLFALIGAPYIKLGSFESLIKHVWLPLTSVLVTWTFGIVAKGAFVLLWAKLASKN